IHPQSAGPFYAGDQGGGPPLGHLDPRPLPRLGDGRGGAGGLAGGPAAGARRLWSGAAGSAGRGDSGPGGDGVTVRPSPPRLSSPSLPPSQPGRGGRKKETHGDREGTGGEKPSFSPLSQDGRVEGWERGAGGVRVSAVVLTLGRSPL